MSFNQTDADAGASKRTPLEITDWNALVDYVSSSFVTIQESSSLPLSQTKYLNRAGNQTIKICVIDEENEEIRIDNKEEFNTNVEVDLFESLRFKWSYRSRS